MSTEEPMGYSGAMERSQAEKILGGRPVGTFLIRWSPKANSFVLSYVGRHSLISHIGKISPVLSADDMQVEEKRKSAPIVVTTETGQQQKYDNLLHFVNTMKQSKKITDPIDKRKNRKLLERKDTYEVINPGMNSRSLTKEETELVSFMHENGLDEFVDTFLMESIDIDTIRYVTKETLTEMKITQIGQQMKILKAIEKLSGGDFSNKPVYLRGINVGKLLGMGQGGSVYKGIWNSTTPVALKALHSTNDPNNQEQENFKREASVLMSLNHPHILRFLGLFIDNEKKLYIVTEFMEKGSLLEIVKTPNLSGDVLLRMAKDIASGMTYLEQNSVVHRDLSCRNCLVGSAGEVKVADFGLSRILDSGNYLSSKRIMPFKWCAPETLDKSIWNHKTDVWSFGVVLWEMWSNGEEPYGTKKNKEVSEFVRDGGRLEKPKNCPDPIFEIMKSCWAVPDKRPTFAALYSKIESTETPSSGKDEHRPTTQPSTDNYIDE